MNHHTLTKPGFESFDNAPSFGAVTDALKPVLEAEAHNDLLPRLTQRWTGTRPAPRIWSLDDFTSPIVLPCIEPYLAKQGWKTHGVTGADQASPEHETSPFEPPYQRLSINALYFVEDTKQDARMIVASNEGGTRYTQVIFDGKGADEALAGFKDFVQEYNPLRGRAFDLDGKLLELPKQPPPPVVLTDEQRRCVDRHIVLPVQKAAALGKLGSRPSRGVLFEGPPGLGKSHLIKNLVNELSGASVLLATPKQLGGYDAVEHLRQLIRWTTPGLVVILEELDLVGTDRSLGMSPNLGDLLQVLDGIQSRHNNGVIWIATTNRPEVLEEALARPGRFDRRIKFGPLPPEVMGELVETLSQPCGLTPEAEVFLRDKINGFTGAQVREVLETARLIHAERDLDLDAPLGKDAVHEALNDCGFNNNDGFGFKTSDAAGDVE